ncbi:MAG: hypothetical protein N4A53_08565 [Pelagimonas sp.]|jgi:hypothetical protein|nr:hypothetical protein [Pelagimonas sp.]
MRLLVAVCLIVFALPSASVAQNNRVQKSANAALTAYLEACLAANPTKKKAIGVFRNRLRPVSRLYKNPTDHRIPTARFLDKSDAKYPAHPLNHTFIWTCDVVAYKMPAQSALREVERALDNRGFKRVGEDPLFASISPKSRPAKRNARGIGGLYVKGNRRFRIAVVGVNRSQMFSMHASELRSDVNLTRKQ